MYHHEPQILVLNRVPGSKEKRTAMNGRAVYSLTLKVNSRHVFQGFASAVQSVLDYEAMTLSYSYMFVFNLVGRQQTFIAHNTLFQNIKKIAQYDTLSLNYPVFSNRALSSVPESNYFK